jgi:flagellar biosynthesis GTPase FlhF
MYTISGNVNNIRTGTTMVLQNNGADNITIEAGRKSFSFTNKVKAGAGYNVKVLSQRGQKCEVKKGAGTVYGADITNIVVECFGPTDEQPTNSHIAFSEALMLNKGFVVSGSKAKNITDNDPTVECIDQIAMKKEFRGLDQKIKLERSLSQPFEIRTDTGFPGKTEQKVIFMSLSELKKCKKSGDESRNNSNSPEIIAVIDKSYADLFDLVVNLYAKKIRYADYIKKNLSIRKRFSANVRLAIKQEQNKNAEAQKLKDLEQQQKQQKQQEQERQLAEKQRLDTLAQQIDPKVEAEKQRLSALAQKEEDQMLQAEVQRIKDIELRKKQHLEQEKKFHPLYQRQQLERMR